MKKYIVLYHTPTTAAQEFAKATPEQAMEGFKLWVAWQQKLGANLVDPGLQLGNAMTVTKNGVGKSDTTVSGYSILQANSMDEALEMVKNHHFLHWAEGSEITILEEMPIPEMEAQSKG